MSARISRIAESPGAAGPALRLADDAPWYEHAACRGRPVDEFYPDLGRSAAENDPRTVCSGCPVRQPCLDDAIGYESQPGMVPHGFYGGLSPLERKPLITARRAEMRQQDRGVAA